mgnify:CR=1 FL=1
MSSVSVVVSQHTIPTLRNPINQSCHEEDPRRLRSAFVAPMATYAAALTLVLTAPIQAQQPDDPTPVANPADVGSIDTIMTALYDVISGPIGQDRDRARFLSLLAEGVRLIPPG